MPEKFNNFIGGKWENSISGNNFENVNPATGEILLKDGQKIYRNTKMTISEPSHTFVQHDRVNEVVETQVQDMADMML